MIDAIEIHKAIVGAENARFPFHMRLDPSLRDRCLDQDDDRALLPEIEPLKYLGFPSLNIYLKKIDGASRAVKLQQIRQRR